MLSCVPLQLFTLFDNNPRATCKQHSVESACFCIWMYFLHLCSHPNPLWHPTFSFSCFDRRHAAGGTEARGTFQHWICHGAYWCEDFRGHYEYARKQWPGLLQGMSIRSHTRRAEVTLLTRGRETKREGSFESRWAMPKVYSTTSSNYVQD